MGLTRSICRIAAGMTVATALAVGAAGGQAVSEREWVELRSEHLVLYTDGDEALGRSILQTLEVLRAAVSKLTFGSSLEPQLPTTLLVFSSESSYAPYRLHGRDGAFFSAGLLRIFRQPTGCVQACVV